MNTLHKLGAAAAMIFLAAGGVQLYRLGLHDGVPTFCAAAGSGFALSLTLYVFQLRGRIAALERSLRERRGE